MKRRIPVFILLMLLLTLQQINAQQAGVSAVKTDAAILKDFMAKRFGMFIHWGPVTLRGTEIGWSRGNQVPAEDYDNLYKEFNPVLFNASQWVKAAKDAGMKYIVITAKHHDGFCLWPSKFTDYNIMGSLYKKDIVAELSKACKEQGIAFGIYCTVLDWHDPLYPVSNIKGESKPKTTADMRKFLDRLKNEVGELITNYHPFMLWFDGNWEAPWTKEMGEELYAHIKKLDKNVIVNNRIGKGSHLKFSNESVGDYLTPEQKVGEINMEQPWESCITIAKQWAWKPNDAVKSEKQSLQILTQTAGGNGNLLYNVGPMPDGRMEVRQLKLLDSIGLWLKRNGEAIYNTSGGPYKPNPIFSATRKGKKIFINLTKTDTASIKLPSLPEVKILKAYILGTNQPVPFQQDASGINLDFAAVKKDAIVPVIALETDKETISIPVINH